MNNDDNDLITWYSNIPRSTQVLAYYAITLICVTIAFVAYITH